MIPVIRDETIAALSTPPGKAGIAIVRLSGKEAIAIADTLFRGGRGERLCQVPSHTMSYGRIVEGTDEARVCVDEVLVCVMRAPRTYTREDVVEINAHGGMAVVQKILGLLIARGAVPARPGEFTQRALLNGRIDLVQAEAILALIDARTTAAAQLAAAQLAGRLSERVRALHGQLVELQASLEADIEFETDESVSPDEFARHMASTAADLASLRRDMTAGAIFRDGARVSICGKPNVGKSSLLNALVRRDRAIVTPIPGTTRDTIEDVIDIRGIPLRIIDTAGIIQTTDPVEEEGVARSYAEIAGADLVLWVIDVSSPFDENDRAVIGAIMAQQKKVLAVANKVDRGRVCDLSLIGALGGGCAVIEVSAREGTHIPALEEALYRAVQPPEGAIASEASAVMVSARQQAALDECARALDDARAALVARRYPEVIAADLKSAVSAVEQMVGIRMSADVFGAIFSRFCVGK